MKKCKNCKKDIRDNDKYCRNCGCKVLSAFYYIFMDIVISVIAICLFVMLVMFVASYFV